MDNEKFTPTDPKDTPQPEKNITVLADEDGSIITDENGNPIAMEDGPENTDTKEVDKK